jgi:hypothetical protein
MKSRARFVKWMASNNRPSVVFSYGLGWLDDHLSEPSVHCPILFVSVDSTQSRTLGSRGVSRGEQQLVRCPDGADAG